MEASFTDEGGAEETVESVVTSTVVAATLPTVTVAPLASPVSEGADAQFRVTRARVTAGALTVRYDVSESGDMVASGDEGAKTVAFGDGDTERTVTVPTAEDAGHEADSTVTVTLTADAAYDLGTDDTADVTVEDDDNAVPTGAPTIDDTTPVVGETLTADASGIVDADGLTGAAFTWQWVRVSGGTDTRISGATAVSYTVVAADEGATLKVEVGYTDDDGTAETVESAETSAVEAAPPLPALSIGDASVDEGDTGSAALDFTVTLDQAATETVTVNWTTSDGTATAGTDYTAGNGALTFNAGDASKTVSVTVSGDNVDEPNETFEVTLSGASGATIGDDTATGTITDDDDPPTVTLVLTPDTMTENNGESTVTATLDHPSSEDTTVTVTATPEPPAVSGDYTLSGSQLTIAAGETTSTGEVTITAVNNDVDAADKEVTVSATATNTQGITNPGSVTLSITDDDAPALSIGDASVTEGDAGESASLTFTVTLTPAATLPVTVDWVTSDGTATAGTDYTAGNGTLTFNIGDASRTVSVAVDGDNMDEANETFTVTLSNASSGATIGDGAATGTITDDDATPTVTLHLSPDTIDEDGGTSTLTASLDRPSSEDTTVRDIGGTNFESFYTVGPGPNPALTIPAGGTASAGVVTLTAVDNNVDAPDKRITVSAEASNSVGVTFPDDVTLTIRDDDDPPTVTLRLSPDTISEDGGTSTATASLSHPSGLDTTVTVTAAPVSPAVVGDYRLSSNVELTISAGSMDSMGVVTVTAVDNNVDAPDKEVTVWATTTNAHSGSVLDSAPLTIEDDEGPPMLSIGDASVAEGDGGDATLTFTVALAPQATGTVTVDWATADGTAEAGTDYRAGSGSLTFNAGDASRTVSVAVAGDDVDEPNETFRVRLSNPAGAMLGRAVATGTIIDDDGEPAPPPPPPQRPVLSIGDAQAAEGDAALAFSVTLNRRATGTVAVDWATADGTAEAGTDYRAGSGTLTFNAGQTSGTVSVSVSGDSVDEPNETLTVTLSNPSGATIGDGAGTGTIVDDDDAPRVTLVLTPEVIDEAGGTSRVTARLDHPSSADTRVTVSAAPAPPAASGDYALSSNLLLTIPAGATESAGLVTIAALDNDADAPDRTVTVSAAATNDQGVVAPRAVALTIADDDEAPVLSIGDAQAAEGDAGGAALAFSVTLDRAATAEVTVDWATADGTAQAGTDYAAGRGTLTFKAGETSGTVSVSVSGDSVDEPDETFTVTLSNPSGATLADGVGTGTIADDDDAPRVTLVLTPEVIDEAGGTSTVTARLDRPSSADTRVTVSAAPAPPAASGGYALSSNLTLTIPAGATESAGLVTIAALDNDADAPDRTVTVSAAATNDQGVVAPRAVALTIADDDDAPSLSIGDAEAAEGDAGGAALAFRVTLDRAAAGEVTVDWATADGTAQAGTDYAAGSGTLTFGAGETSGTVSVLVSGDRTDEPDETFTVTLSNPSGATLADGVGTGTIADDDDAPRVTLVLTPEVIDEAGGTSTVTARLDRPSSADTRVTVSAAPAPPAASGGYALSSNLTLVIPAGATESAGLVTIAALDNDADAPDRTVTVSAAATNDQGVVAPRAVALTIADDDEPPVLSIGDAQAAEGDAALVFAVTLDRAAAEVTVDWATVDGTAQAGTDYAAGSGSLRFGAGETSGTVSVLVSGDRTDEPDETFTVTLSNPSGATLADGVGTGTIVDDDDAPVVTLVLTPDVIDEAGGTSRVTARLDRPSSADTTVTVSAAPVAPAASGDYALSSNLTLAIPAGATESAGLVTLAAVDNDVDAPDRTVTVSAAATNDQGIVAPRAVALTIADDDEAPVLSIGDAEAAEGAVALEFRVTLDRAAVGEVTVDWATADGTAQAGTDYSAGSGTLTFEAGETGGTVSVVVSGDSVDEPDETLTVRLSNASGATLGDDTGTGTIVDDDLPLVTVAAETDAVAEGGSAVFILTRAGELSNELSVAFEVTGGDGVLAGAPPAGAAFGAGEVEARVVLATQDDLADEADAEVVLTLSDGDAYDLGEPSAAAVAVRDDDDPPAVSVAAVTERVSEGEDAEFELMRTGDLSQALTAMAEVSERGGDMVLAASEGARRVAFEAGASTALLRVATADDGMPEPDSRVTVSVLQGDGAYQVGRPGSATVAVADGGGASVLGEGRRAGAASLLSRHVQRFARLTSRLAMARLHRGHRAPVADDRPAVDGRPAADDRANGNGAVAAADGEAADHLLSEWVDRGASTTEDGVGAGGAAAHGGASAADAGVDGDGVAAHGEVAGHPPSVRANRAPAVDGGADRDGAAAHGDALAANAGVDGNGVAARGRVASGSLSVWANRGVTMMDDGADGSGSAAGHGFTSDPASGCGRHGVPAVGAGVHGGGIAAHGGAMPGPSSGWANRGAPAVGGGVRGAWPMTQVGGAPDSSLGWGRHDAALAVSGVHGGGIAAHGGAMPGPSSGWANGGVPAAGVGAQGAWPAAHGGVASDPSLGCGRHGVPMMDADVREGGIAAAAHSGGVTFGLPLGRGARRVDVGVGDGGVTANGGVALDVPSLWGVQGASTLDVGFNQGQVAANGGVALDVPLLWGGRGASRLDFGVNGDLVALRGDALLDLPLGPGGLGASTVAVNFSQFGVAANGDVAVDLPLGWDGWSSIQYSKLNGAADGGVWDVYAGADYLDADGRTLYGALIGYEPGRMTSRGVRLEADHVQLGLYGAHRLNGKLTIDGALGWGHGKGDLSLVRDPGSATASYRSKRLVARGDLTGDFGWGGEQLRVEPQIGLLYAEEDLGAFTDSLGGAARSDRLWLGRLGFGPMVTRQWESGTTHAQLRVNLDAHNLGASGGRQEDISASLTLARISHRLSRAADVVVNGGRFPDSGRRSVDEGPSGGVGRFGIGRFRADFGGWAGKRAGLGPGGGRSGRAGVGGLGYPAGTHGGWVRRLARISWRRAAWGYDSENDSQTLRTLTFTRAPTFRKRSRIVEHWARAAAVPASPSRRRPCIST